MYKNRFIVLIVITLIVQGLIYGFVIQPINSILKLGEETIKQVDLFKVSVNEKNWDGIKVNLGNISDLSTEYENFLITHRFLAKLPVISSYYQDLINIFPIANNIIDNTTQLIVDLTPFKSVFGFTEGIEVENGQQLKEILQITPQLVPYFNQFLDDLKPSLISLSEFDLTKYQKVEQVAKYLDFWNRNSAAIISNIDQINNTMSLIPPMLGVPDIKKYLIIFQNDKELRPTGGFMTAYTIANVKDGQVDVAEAQNIYEINDGGIYYDAPQPINVYLGQSKWHLRDTNFSPDYVESMNFFYDYWIKIGEPKVDGIIAIDTQFVAHILENVDPIEVVGYNTDFSTWNYLPNDCQDGGNLFTSTNVVCRLELYAEKLSTNDTSRKDILGYLMRGIFNRFMEIPIKELIPLGLNIVNQLNQKHVVVYLFDQKQQEFIDYYNWSGRIRDFTGDYLYINDANLGGLKSDMYLIRNVEQIYTENNNGETIKNVKITYENTAAFDGWLNAKSRNYVRLYVPIGSELISVDGGSVQTNVYDDLGKTVFDNFMQIYPLTSESIEFSYKLPETLKNTKSIYLQKQPGIDTTQHKLNYLGKERIVDLTTDQVIYFE